MVTNYFIQVILRLQSKEVNNESLFTAVTTRSKGAKRLVYIIGYSCNSIWIM